MCFAILWREIVRTLPVLGFYKALNVLGQRESSAHTCSQALLGVRACIEVSVDSLESAFYGYLSTPTKNGAISAGLGRSQ